MLACHQFKRVLITCRTQFFPKEEEIPRETGIARVGPRKPGEAGEYEFWKLYLSPLNDRQVSAFLRRRYPWPWGQRKKAREVVDTIPLLSVRPMLLAYIPDLLESGQDIHYAYQLYQVLVEKWLERERGWVDDKDTLRGFSERLAVDLYVNRKSRGGERIRGAELEPLAEKWNIRLDGWQLRGRSLLNRDAEGNYKFAHRSIMEYLLVSRFADGDEACGGIEWTDQMLQFVWEMIKHHSDANEPLPFDATQLDLSRFQLSLRSSAVRTLSHSEHKLGLITNDLYDGIWNKSARRELVPLFVVHERADDKIVNDYVSGLTWAWSSSGDLNPPAEVDAYIQRLNTRSYGGYNDWRLPTVEEASSLMEPKSKKNDVEFGLGYGGKGPIWTADHDPDGFPWGAYIGETGFGFNQRDSRRLMEVLAVRRSSGADARLTLAPAGGQGVPP